MPDGMAISRGTDAVDLRLAILADDLTGACDSAAPFGTADVPVPIFLGLPRLPAEDPRIWAMDLNVRDSPSTRARDVARRAATAVGGARRIFLKVDSAGRGAIGALADGTLEGTRSRAIILAPAFPRRGTIVVGGLVRLEGSTAGAGRDLMRLDAADDHQNRRAVLITRPTVRRGPDALAREIENAIDQGASLVVVDADSNRCLTSIAAAWLALSDVVLAGSGGVTRALAHLVGGSRPGGNPLGSLVAAEVDRRGGPILVVSGSLSPATSAQLAELEARWPGGFVRLDPDDSTPDDPALAAAHVVAFVTVGGPSVIRDDGHHARVVAQAAASWGVRVGGLDGLVLVGGATARAFLDEAGADGLDVFGEIASGIPYGTVKGGSLDGVGFVTKAGRFGETDALAQAVDYLMQRKG